MNAASPPTCAHARPRPPTTRRSSPCSPATAAPTAASASTATATQGNEPSTLVQRINYDRALNGRITVYGQGGNDAFYVDDTQATMTLDGGAGNDTFQIGQIFGTKRDVDATARSCRPTRSRRSCRPRAAG